MASPSIRPCRAWGGIAFAGLIGIMAGGSAGADVRKVLPDVPRFKLFASYHSTAAAEVMAYYGVKKGLHTGRAGRRVTREFQHHPATRSRHE